jgi:lactate permease
VTDLQSATAERLALPATVVLGAQAFGAAVGNIICPHNIVAAGATVDLGGAEGEVLRRTAPVALAYAVLGGVTAFVWIALL